MNKSSKMIAALLVTSSLVGIGSQAIADGAKGSDAPAVTTVPISQDQAVNIALLNVPGTVQSSEFELDNNTKLWDIEIVNSAGELIDVSVDASTGDMIAHTPASRDHDDEGDDQEDEDDHENGSAGSGQGQHGQVDRVDD